MGKWGVRIIAILFFAFAIWDVYALASGGKTDGAFGFDLGLTKDGKPDIDYMAYVEVVASIYIGVQLLRFHPSGRRWALRILWWFLFLSGVFIFLEVRIVYLHYAGEVDFGAPTWLDESLRPIFLLITSIVSFVVVLIPLDFLLGEDVKRLFDKTPPPPDANITPEQAK